MKKYFTRRSIISYHNITLLHRMWSNDTKYQNKLWPQILPFVKRLMFIHLNSHVTALLTLLLPFALSSLHSSTSKKNGATARTRTFLSWFSTMLYSPPNTPSPSRKSSSTTLAPWSSTGSPTAPPSKKPPETLTATSDLSTSPT